MTRPRSSPDGAVHVDMTAISSVLVCSICGWRTVTTPAGTARTLAAHAAAHPHLNDRRRIEWQARAYRRGAPLA